MPATKRPFTLPTSPDALTAIIRRRPARPAALTQIVETLVPVRTCYETMVRLVGPVDAVLDYASFLFAGEDSATTHPTPSLTVEEAHLSDDGDTLTVVLARGSFTVA